MTTTAQVVFEQHHHGFRLTIRRGGTQLWFGDSLTADEVAARCKRYGCVPADVTVLPAQD